MGTFFVWSRAVFAAFGGFMFGYDIGPSTHAGISGRLFCPRGGSWDETKTAVSHGPDPCHAKLRQAINGVKDMVGFRQTFNLSYSDGNETVQCEDDVETSAILGLIVAILSIGAIPGVLLGGVFSDWIGRKKSIIIGAAMYGVGGALQTGAVHISMIYLGRVIAGFGVGVLFTVMPIYIAELAPKNLRGRLVGLTIAYLVGGIMLALIINLVCRRLRFGWRITLSVAACAGAILTIGSIFLPESPRWLVKKCKYQEAEKVLGKIYGAKNHVVAQEQLKEIEEAIQGKNTLRSVLKVFLTWRVIHRVLIGVVLQIYNSFAGIHVIMYYSVTISCMIGLPPYITSIVFGVVNVISMISLLVIDKLGRKALLLLGAIGNLCSMILASTLLLVFRVEDDGGSKAVEYIVVAAICVFVFSYAATTSPVSWAVNSEIHPLKVRGLAVSLSTLAYWVVTVIMAQLTPIMLASALQTHGTFYFLAGVNLAGFFFVLLMLPETKGESLEKLDMLFTKPWSERVDLFYYLRCGCPWWRRKKQDTVSNNGGPAQPFHSGKPTGRLKLVIDNPIFELNSMQVIDGMLDEA